MTGRWRRIFVFVGTLAASMPPAAAQARAPRTLVENGKPLFTIVLPEGAGEIDRRAAEILKDAVLRMSGAILPIVEKARPGAREEILIGFPAALLPRAFGPALAKLKPDGFLLALGRNLYVASGGGKGAVYGVVELLERYFGCRRYSPTVELFPRRETLVLPPLFAADNPVNAFRCVYGEFARDPDYRDWMRLNTTDELFAAGYFVHTFGRLLPAEEHFKAHPEYFALVNGKRIAEQFCPSHPDVLRLAVEKLRAEMAAQPDKKVWSVSQNDNSYFCRCPGCSAIIEEEGSPAGPILRFVNAVAAAFPDKTISTLAYQYSRPAPRKTKPAANVQIMLCTIELNRSRPIAEDPSSASFVKDLEDWGRLTNNIYLWDYTVNFSHFISPFPNLDVLGPNIRFFVGRGARFHFQQTNTGPGHEFSELKSWLLARLLWNPGIDAAAEMRDFLGGYYGPAGIWIGRYIDALQAALRESGAALDIYEPPAAHAGDFLSAENVARYNRLFDNALAAAPDRSVQARVRAARLPLQYAMLEIGKADLFGPRGFYAESGGRFELRPEKTRLLDDFYAACLEAGVRSLNEAGLTPFSYLDVTRRFIDVQAEGDLAFRKTVRSDPPPSSKYGRGDVARLTDGGHGGDDYKVHWLGWEGVDFDLTLDLGRPGPVREMGLHTLYDPGSWILHPRRVTCLVSEDGAAFQPVGAITVDGDQRREDAIRAFTWAIPFDRVRFIKFHVEGTKRLAEWHPSSGEASWVFVDEVVVR